MQSRMPAKIAIGGPLDSTHRNAHKPGGHQTSESSIPTSQLPYSIADSSECLVCSRRNSQYMASSRSRSAISVTSLSIASNLHDCAIFSRCSIFGKLECSEVCTSLEIELWQSPPAGMLRCSSLKSRILRPICRYGVLRSVCTDGSFERTRLLPLSLSQQRGCVTLAMRLQFLRMNFSVHLCCQQFVGETQIARRRTTDTL